MRQMITENNLFEIPSEYIEPYLTRWMMMELESLSIGMTTPDNVRESMKWMARFASRFCGIHARIAANNESNKIRDLTDEQMITIAKETFD